MHKSGIAVVVVTFLLVSVASAGDLEDEPFAMRLLLSLERATNFAETLGLQAAAADPEGYSMNPAGGGLRKQRGPTATLSTVNAFSSSGAWITAMFAHAGFSPGEDDRLSFAYAHTVTIDGDSRGNFENEFGSDEFYLRYSRAISDTTSLGAELRYIGANVQEETIPIDLGFPAGLTTDIAGPDLNLGIQSRVGENLTLGFVADFGIEWTDTRVENLIPIPVPGLPGATMPIGTRLDTIDSKVVFFDIRGGAAYTVGEDIDLLADIQYLDYDIQDLSKFSTWRFFAGTRFRIVDELHLSIGAGYDLEGELTAGGGLAYSPASSTVIALGYQYDAFPEVRQEYGQFQVITLSVTFEF